MFSSTSPHLRFVVIVSQKSMYGHDSRSPPISPTGVVLGYSHVSIYKSRQIQLQLHSRRVQTYHDNNKYPLAVFNDNDTVGGEVILESPCHHSGRLSISIEGDFNYHPTSVHVEQSFAPERRRHVFFSSSTVIAVSLGNNSSSRLALRDAFIKHQPSVSGRSATSVDKRFAFAFQLPRSCKSGGQMPPSFSSSHEYESNLNSFDVLYKIKVIWEARNAIDTPSVLEVPILFHPDQGPKSVTASLQNPQAWLELPLKSDREMPFRCMVTFPAALTFSPSSYIPYFIVFTTMPRSPALAQEIASDATISLSILRRVSVTEQIVSPSSSPTTHSSLFDPLRNKLLRCIGRGGQSNVKGKKPRRLQDKPLPPLPNRTFTDITTLQSTISTGFPKRPRLQFDGRGHPSLEKYAALPDGLSQNKILVPKGIFPSTDLAGLSVKYYLDVSVNSGLEGFRARVPIHIM